MNISYLDLKDLMSDYNERLGAIINCYNNCIRELIENNEIDLNKLEDEYDTEFYLINEKEIKFNLIDVYSLLHQIHIGEDYYHVVTLTDMGDSYCGEAYVLQNRYQIPVSIFNSNTKDIENILKSYLKNKYENKINKIESEEE